MIQARQEPDALRRALASRRGRMMAAAVALSALVVTAILTATVSTDSGPAVGDPSAGVDAPRKVDKYKAWPNGPNPTGDDTVFPIGVWLQGPERSADGTTPNAVAYQQVGITQNYGLSDNWPNCDWCDWRIQEAVAAGWDQMPTPTQNARNALTPEIGAVVTGWLLGDEADQNKVNGDPADKPDAYLAAGNAARRADPTRPIYSNFGAPFAGPFWAGYAPEPGSTYQADMRKYAGSSDIISSDIYAYTNPWVPDSHRGAWCYGRTIDLMRFYAGPDKISYGFVEASHPFNFTDSDPSLTITPDQMEAAIWNMIVHGADGLIYFAHHFDEVGFVDDDDLLRRPEIKARVAAVNARIKSLAAVLNRFDSPGVSVSSTNNVPVTFMHKLHGGSHWILAQADGNENLTHSGASRATFTLPVSGTAEVVGEGRTVQVVGGKLVDDFGPYGFHVYKITS